MRRAIRLVEMNEPHVRTSDPAHIGDCLVAASDWLRSCVQFPFEGIPAEDISADHELSEWFGSDEDTLIAFIEALYSDGD
ncbi:MAG: hypothetical protein EOP09_17770 [Proteobacteria bacterium]|nr:MAG: hypothetical protein EOP09_17770 [Pseudomonadota bacterium]